MFTSGVTLFTVVQYYATRIPVTRRVLRHRHADYTVISMFDNVCHQPSSWMRQSHYVCLSLVTRSHGHTARIEQKCHEALVNIVAARRRTNSLRYVIGTLLLNAVTNRRQRDMARRAEWRKLTASAGSTLMNGTPLKRRAAGLSLSRTGARYQVEPRFTPVTVFAAEHNIGDRCRRLG